jgi:hypothetical protein
MRICRVSGTRVPPCTPQQCPHTYDGKVAAVICIPKYENITKTPAQRITHPGDASMWCSGCIPCIAAKHDRLCNSCNHPHYVIEHCRPRRCAPTCSQITNFAAAQASCSEAHLFSDALGKGLPYSTSGPSNSMVLMAGITAMSFKHLHRRGPHLSTIKYHFSGSNIGCTT